MKCAGVTISRMISWFDILFAHMSTRTLMSLLLIASMSCLESTSKIQENNQNLIRFFVCLSPWIISFFFRQSSIISFQRRFNIKLKGLNPLHIRLTQVEIWVNLIRAESHNFKCSATTRIKQYIIYIYTSMFDNPEPENISKFVQNVFIYFYLEFNTISESFINALLNFPSKFPCWNGIFINKSLLISRNRQILSRKTKKK